MASALINFEANEMHMVSLFFLFLTKKMLILYPVYDEVP